MSGPPPTEPRGPSPRSVVHLGVFLVLLAVWTWKLLEPYPVPPSVADDLSPDVSFILAKSLHAGVYAVLAVLAWTLPAARRWRLFLVVVLFLHGVGTEVGQTYVPNRHGCVQDVLIDWAGITAGLLALRWARSVPRSPSGRG
jgi:VanZ family protein